MKQKAKPQSFHRDQAIHAMILAVYAKYAGHPHACSVHVWAAQELAK